MEQNNQYNALKFDLDRVIGYHNMRAGFFQAWHHRALFAIVVALAFPVMVLIDPVSLVFKNASEQMGANWYPAASGLAALLSFFGLIAAVYDIMINPSEKFARHRAAELMYLNIKTDLIGVATESEVAVLRVRYERVDSSFEERHVVVNAVSYNRVAREFGIPVEEVPLWKKLLMHYLPFSATKV